jgi:hypothetical protein
MAAFRKYKAAPDYWMIDDEEEKGKEEQTRSGGEKNNYNSFYDNTIEVILSHMEEKPSEHNLTQNYHNNLFKITMFACFVFVLFMFTVSGTIYTIYKKDGTRSTDSTVDEIIDATDDNKNFATYTKTLYDTINVTVSNEYGIYNGAKYGWLTNKYLAEPYKTTSLSVNVDTENILWKWEEEDTDNEYWGKTLEKIFTNTGEYNLYLSGLNSNNETIVSKTIPIIVKYVKRELRSLTSADRHKFLHAASKIWKYTSSEGRAKYGDKFTGINELVEEHALASNDIKCDQFHEGSGFFTHHFAITQTFEAALRSIDPSVTLPYWDFTIEGQQIKDADESPSYFLEVTPFLNDKWFGSTDENGHVQDSKFAYAKMPKVTNTSIVAPNSYGYIRSYWNNNNDEYAVRHLFDICGVEAKNKRIPSCQTHFDIINVTTLSDFQILSPNDGHGTVHVQLGGMGGECVETYKNFTDTWSYLLDAEMTPEEIMSHGYTMDEWEWGTQGPRRTMLENMVMGEYFHVYKSLWRSHMCSRDGTPNLLVCPENCDEGEECSCTVESLINGTTDWENVYNCILSGHSQQVFNKIFPEEFIIDMVYMLSTMSSIEGEMLESSSPIDILFWVIHPTLERLLAAKRVDAYVDFGGTPIYKWPTVDGSEETWYSFSYFSLEENENAYWPEKYTCTGHDATDSVLPASLPLLDGFAELADTDGDGIITNIEYYLAINPNNEDGLDYVFDHFEWSHC